MTAKRTTSSPQHGLCQSVETRWILTLQEASVDGVGVELDRTRVAFEDDVWRKDGAVGVQPEPEVPAGHEVHTGSEVSTDSGEGGRQRSVWCSTHGRRWAPGQSVSYKEVSSAAKQTAYGAQLKAMGSEHVPGHAATEIAWSGRKRPAWLNVAFSTVNQVLTTICENDNSFCKVG